MAHILVVDDDDAVRALCCHVLEASGHTVSAAASGDAAIRSFLDRPADLVVCDLRMPGKNGLETLACLRAADCRVRLIAVSGSCETLDSYRAALTGIGVTNLLDKPFRLTDLVATVDGVLAA